MKYLYLLAVICFLLPTLVLNAQKTIPAKVPLENYRKILMAHTEDIVRFAELEWRCLEDLEDACSCNNIFSTVVNSANRNNMVDLDELNTSLRYCYPGIRFTSGLTRNDVLTIMANERLIKLRDSKVLAFDNGHYFVENNWYEEVLGLMNLNTADEVAVLQSGDHLLGEVMSAAGLNNTIVVVNNLPNMSQALFRAAPQVEADFWRLPHYVSSEELELPEGEEPNKVVLLDVLRDYHKPAKTLRQLATRLYPNDEVFVVEAIDSSTGPYFFSSLLTPKECDKLMTKRNYELLESQARNGFYMARYRYVSPKNTKVHFAWKPQRTRANRTGNQR